MARSACYILLFLCALQFVACSSLFGFNNASDPKVYIVYMGMQEEKVRRPHELTEVHLGMLTGVSAPVEAILYSYNRGGFNGFAAKLEPHQAAALEEMPGVVSVFESQTNYVQTSRSWAFMDLENANGQVPPGSLWAKSNGRGAIIGVIDSGIYPDSLSFQAGSAQFPPVPTSWNGRCQFPVVCTRKLIGARYYSSGYEAQHGPIQPPELKSPVDTNGHGTHVASIATGMPVPGANQNGLATGVAKGGAGLAWLASYKVIWRNTLTDADLLAALNDAIADGVDIINLSLGKPSTRGAFDYLRDAMSLGTFAAMRSQISVVCAAGNSGPSVGTASLATVTNIAPWILTVGASTMDREFQRNVVLGDGSTIRGVSWSPFPRDDKFYPLAYGRNIPAAGFHPDRAEICYPGALNPAQARGRIILCSDVPPGVITNPFEPGQTVLAAGGLGMILGKPLTEWIEPTYFPLPAAVVSREGGIHIHNYITSARDPKAYILPLQTIVPYSPAPVMAGFSSRGPNPITQEILKPDITAPGVGVLASGLIRNANRFVMLSGTSMAAPHVTGVATLLKQLHPQWSPAAVMSALMTTARTRFSNTPRNCILDGHLGDVCAGPQDYGNGHMDPNAAADPGLVYDADARDYALFLCSIGYNSAAIFEALDLQVNCAAQRAVDMNRASVSVVRNNMGSTTVTRTLTQVGSTVPQTYRFTSVVDSQAQLTITANPQSLTFTRVGENRTFTLTVSIRGSIYAAGEFAWENARYQVRSPVVVNVV